MILEKEPLTMAQAKSLVPDFEDRSDLEAYFKKFTSLDEAKSKKLTEDLVALKNLKIKQSDIVKLVDFLPKNLDDLNKIFTEVSLSEEEANAILDILKKY
ncbi:hypothetical protein CMI47_17525 [Candidatus Pacearchaeota archaeon]|nr:hypothetical protein [Candidatus Pacearchaeota archaeon]|tara:strand:+ start:385 stop:684 length:300 start_codon:yes stop_codon:yes gene_type:complete